jgi:hypothetical protein
MLYKKQFLNEFFEIMELALTISAVTSFSSIFIFVKLISKFIIYIIIYYIVYLKDNIYLK